MAYVNLQIQGKSATCQFTILTLRKYCDSYDLSLAEFHNHLALKAPFSYADMAYYAYETFCNVNGNEVLLSKEEFSEYVSEMSEKEANDISEAILEIKMMGKTFKERAEDTKKKNR